jgi:hypothetical protein
MSELMAIYADKQKAEAAVMNRPDLSNAAKKEAMDDIEEMYQAAKQDVLARQAKGKKRERLEELAAGASMTKVEMAESHKPLQRKYVAHSKWSSHDLLRKSIHEAEEGNWLTPFAGRKGSSKKIRTHFVMTNGCCFMANGDDEPTLFVAEDNVENAVDDLEGDLDLEGAERATTTGEASDAPAQEQEQEQANESTIFDGLVKSDTLGALLVKAANTEVKKVHKFDEDERKTFEKEFKKAATVKELKEVLAEAGMPAEHGGGKAWTKTLLVEAVLEAIYTSAEAE